jgi:tRNA 2-selenouridine synthase
VSKSEEIELQTILDKGLENINLIDVRSPSEYVHDHIPTSANIPLLDDEERAVVGTCYVQQGPKDARLLGVDIVSPKLPQFIREFLKFKENNKMTVVYCWRGGLRSNGSAGLVKLAGMQVYVVRGGYKTYRNMVNGFFQNFSEDYSFINFYGPTGCAKSVVLRNLETAGLPVLDLEHAAAHKGSSFGEVDEPEYKDVTQKNFESKLWHTFYKHGAGKYLVEGESMRIGKVGVPKPLFTRMMESISVVADVPMDFRIAFTVENYKPDRYIDEIRESLSRLKKYIGKSQVDELSGMLDRKDFETFTKVLLESYYDPLYSRSIPEKPDYVIRYDSIESAEKQLAEIYAKHKTS